MRRATLLLAFSLLLVSTGLALAQGSGPLQEVRRGGKTYKVYQDPTTYKLQAVVPASDDAPWNCQLPPFDQQPEVFFRVTQGTRDVMVDFIRLPNPGGKPSEYLTAIESTNIKPNWHNYQRQDRDLIFGAGILPIGRSVPFFTTGAKGDCFAFEGVRLMRFQEQDPNTGQPTGKEEVKPDPEGKVFYNQIWAVARSVKTGSGSQAAKYEYYYVFWIMAPKANLDRAETQNESTLDGLRDLFRSIRFLE
ncbi:MAG: hypothetical protein HY720_28605 [Planctomycetes bacterium]|nr:hypothetical protein [Planctomycetota bacterium]